MIVTSSKPMILGKIYRSGGPVNGDTPVGITGKDNTIVTEFCFQVMREATRQEYLDYWHEQGAKDCDLCTDDYYYLVSAD